MALRLKLPLPLDSVGKALMAVAEDHPDAKLRSLDGGTVVEIYYEEDV